MDRNVRLAMILVLGILFIHLFVVMPRLAPPAPATQPPTRPTEIAEPAPQEQAPAATTPTEMVGVEAPPEAGPVPEDELPIETVVLETDFIRVTLSSGGAAIKAVTLPGYEDPFEERPLDLLVATGEIPGIFAFRLAGEDDSEYISAPYRIVGPTATSVTFVRRIAEGIDLAKRYTLTEGTYLIDVQVELRNNSGKEVKLRYGLVGPREITSESYTRGSDISAVYLSTLEKVKLETIPSRKVAKAAMTLPLDNKNWIGLANSYFAAVVETPGYEKIKTAVIFSVKTQEGTIANAGIDFESALVIIPLGGSVAHDFKFFCGPKDTDVLADYGTLSNLISYGFFTPVSRVVLAILRFFHGAPPHNWGIAIIMLTLVVRLALFPLSRRSQLQTQRMQQMQPDLKKIQQKHKNDKKKLAEEQMKLWRKHGANPVGGCVMPMLIQLPVFIALFQGLRNAIELRKAAFLPWVITDLSKPDLVAELPFWPHYLRILPLLSCASMLLSQRKAAAAKSDDPQAMEQQKQQKTMMIMMSMFMLFIFYNMPSGLMLYWTLSSLWGIFEAWLVRRQLQRLPSKSLSK